MADPDSGERDKLNRVVEARRKLRERFLAESAATPSMADDQPMGTGAPNRHGMPRLPPGQHETVKWPVLDLGIHPQISTERWTLQVNGAVARPLTLRWDDFMALEQVEDVSDFHCVTTWSRMDVPWKGVRLADVIELAEPRPGARFLMCHAHDGYTTNLPLAEAVKPDVLLVHTADGAPLAVDHGGPVRVITPQLYAWKGAKWIKRLEVLERDRPGFWEERGYSNTAYPWRNDRYS
jgi:DMSO/TMAO reductase YedYZ molybdopterin-dependent catalytic subunit